MDLLSNLTAFSGVALSLMGGGGGKYYDSS